MAGIITSLYPYGTPQRIVPVIHAIDYWSPQDLGDAGLMINRALAAGQVRYPNGFTCELAPEVFEIATTIVIPANNIRLRGHDWGTVLRPVAGFNGDVIATPIPPTVNTPGYTVAYIVIEDLMIDCSQMAGTVAGQGNGIHLYGAQWSYINRVFVSACPNWAFCIDGGSPNSTYNVHITGCLTDLCAAGIYCGSEASDVVMNVLKWFNSTTAAAQPAFNSPSTNAYNLFCPSGRVHIEDNVFGGGGTQNKQAIQLTNSSRSRIVSNSFDTPKFEAIHLSSATQTLIAFNQFIDPMFGGTAGAIIHVGANQAYIIGNSVELYNAKSYNYCVDEAGSARTGCVYESNQFIVGNSGMFNLAAGSTSVTRSNVGYNPVGKFSAQPAVPASGTAQTNTLGADAMVYITGGTVTAVAIGGQATGLTSGAFRVPAGQTITLTYSAAPTWLWFGD